jgi:hypothetical protein
MLIFLFGDALLQPGFALPMCSGRLLLQRLDLRFRLLLAGLESRLHGILRGMQFGFSGIDIPTPTPMARPTGPPSAPINVPVSRPTAVPTGPMSPDCLTVAFPLASLAMTAFA